MTSLAQLGLQVQYQDVETANRSLDTFAKNASRSQKAVEALAATSIKQAAEQRNASNAIAEGNRQTLAAIQAEQKLEAMRLAAQITAEGRRQSLNRLAQLGRDAVAISHQVAMADAEAARSQDSYNASLERYAAVAAKGMQMQQQAARMAQTGINNRLGMSWLSAAPNTGEDFEAAAAAMDGLRAKYSPLFAASKQYETALNEINDAEARGVLLSHEAAAARESATAAFQHETGAAHAAGRSFGMAGGSLTQLSFQINDIASGLAMGTSPFTILAQQGGQVFQVWQMNPGIFKELGGFLQKAISPAMLLGGGILGIGAALVYVAAKAVETEKALEAALVGPGRAAGVTSSQLGAMALNAANTSKIGLGSARSFAEGYASSGRIVGSQIEELTSLTADYAATTRQDSDAAAKNLVADFSDIGTGIDDLAKRLGYITPAQVQFIKNLAASGQNSKAVQAAIDAMKPSLVDHLSQLTLIGRAWEAIKNAASGAMTAAQDAANPSLDAQIKQAQHGISEAQGGAFGFNMGGAAAIWAGRLRNLLAEKARLEAKASADAAASASNQLAGNALPGILSATPDFAGLVPLHNALNAISKIVGPNGNVIDAQALKDTGLSLQQVTDAQKAYTEAIRSYLTPAQMAQKQAQLDIAALNAKTPAQKAAVAAQQAALQLSGQSVRAGTAEAMVAAARARAYAEAKKALDDQNKAMDIAVQGAEDMAKAYQNGDFAEAMRIAADTQARTENISNGVDVQIKTRKLLTEAVAGQVASQSQDIASQMRLAQVTKVANDNVAAGSLVFDRLNDAVQEQVAILQLKDLRQAAVNAGDQVQIDLIDQLIARYPQLVKLQQANADAQARQAALNPNQGDIRLIRGLQGQPGGAAAIAGTGLHQQATGLMSDLGQANPFRAGMLGRDSMVRQAQDELAQRQKVIDDALAAGDISWEQSEMARAEATRLAALKIRQSDQAMFSSRMGFASDFFGQLATLSQSKNAEIAAFGKAAAITQATIDGVLAVQKALAAYPPPFNFAMAAAVGAATAANVAQIAGFADGVVAVQGPGTGTSDSVLARLSNGESVVTAAATNRNQNTLKAMNAGAAFDALHGGGMGGGGMQVIVQNHTAAGVKVQQISPNQVRIIVREEIGKAAPVIAQSAFNAAERASPNWVAKANQRPRHRAS